MQRTYKEEVIPHIPVKSPSRDLFVRHSNAEMEGPSSWAESLGKAVFGAISSIREEDNFVTGQ